MINKKFGRLKVIGLYGKSKDYKSIWKCICECGNEKNVYERNLKKGHTKSCGCLQKEVVKECSSIHGLSKTRLHRIWRGLFQRCDNKKNPKYKYYGGKGINICEEWRNDFLKFYDWSIKNRYNDNLTIDRINVLNNYEPDNCRWITMEEQSRNRGVKSNNTSGYTGVYFDKKSKKWRAGIMVNDKMKQSKRFENKEDAIKSRKELERLYWG